MSIEFRRIFKEQTNQKSFPTVDNIEVLIKYLRWLEEELSKHRKLKVAILKGKLYNDSSLVGISLYKEYEILVDKDDRICIVNDLGVLQTYESKYFVILD
jgi:hypothetical protein